MIQAGQFDINVTDLEEEGLLVWASEIPQIAELDFVTVFTAADEDEPYCPIVFAVVHQQEGQMPELVTLIHRRKDKTCYLAAQLVMSLQKSIPGLRYDSKNFACQSRIMNHIYEFRVGSPKVSKT